MFVANINAKNKAVNILRCLWRLLKLNISHANIAEINIRIALNTVPPIPRKTAPKKIITMLEITRMSRSEFFNLAFITLK